MKKCTKCGEVKPDTDFTKGLVCFTCRCEYQRQYRIANKVALSQKRRDKWATRSEEQRASEIERGRQRHWKDRDAQLERSKNYYRRNQTKVLARHAVYGQSNRALMTQRMAAWRRANPEKAKSAKAAYYSRMKRVPPWANIGLMLDIYRYAKIMRSFGIDCHVDHIVPLRGRTVSGLHTDANLTVLLARDNMVKSAKLLESAGA